MQGPASGALNTWDRLVRTIRADAAINHLEDARGAVAAVLIPTRSVWTRRGRAVDLAEQMTADVSAVSPEQRVAAMAELGASALPFVQAAWVCDMSIRARSAFSALFGNALLENAMSEGAAEVGPSWPAQEDFLRAVAKMTSLDPVTSELVRLRGARAHGCRLCQSLRSRRAVSAAGGEGFFDPLEDDLARAAGLSPSHFVALRVVDTFVWQPMGWDDELAGEVRSYFTPEEAVELILDVMRNAANKIAVAFGADDPHVKEGVEYYDIDLASGELVYGLPPA